jgi:hypothetical protein
LYGRFLGYDVTVFDRQATIGGSLCVSREKPVPMLPDRCLSPLAISAVTTQLDGQTPPAFPLTIGDWVDQWLHVIATSDLLEDRIRLKSEVRALSLVDLEPSDEEWADEDVPTEDSINNEIPPDFMLEIYDLSKNSKLESMRAECVIACVGSTQLSWLPDHADYLFRVGQHRSEFLEQDLDRARRQIVTIYAQLMGRHDLDLYAPRRK